MAAVDETAVTAHEIAHGIRPRTLAQVPANPVRGPAATWHLGCLATGTRLDDDPAAEAFPLSEPGSPLPSFLRAVYPSGPLRRGPASDGLFQYRQWLPIRTTLPGSGAPVSFRSEHLGAELGLRNLIMTFSGWWPDRGALSPTGTFKEHEAYAVYGRLGSAARTRTLVVASAGNTGRAFLHVAGRLGLPLVVVVPESNLEALWTIGPRSPSVTVIAAGNGADYSDAIALAARLTSASEFRPEGGAKNVARRDGMGTTFLSGALAAGRIPDHYIQAVGSGTGAIAAWEANLRLIASGFGTTMSKLHVVQNAPFAPIVESWQARSRAFILPDPVAARAAIGAIGAPVLANRTAPWSPLGGLYDALEATNGTAQAVTNDEAAAAAEMVLRLEGIDPSPAAAVACAALIRMAREGTVGSDECILLNVTGGGLGAATARAEIEPVAPDLVVDNETIDDRALVEAVREAQRARSRSRVTPAASTPAPPTFSTPSTPRNT